VKTTVTDKKLTPKIILVFHIPESFSNYEQCSKRILSTCKIYDGIMAMCFPRKGSRFLVQCIYPVSKTFLPTRSDVEASSRVKQILKEMGYEQTKIVSNDVSLQLKFPF